MTSRTSENPVEALQHYLSCIAALRQAYPDVREVMDVLQDIKCEPSDFAFTLPETQSPNASFGSIFDAINGDSLYLGAFALSFISAFSFLLLGRRLQLLLRSHVP